MLWPLSSGPVSASCLQILGDEIRGVEIPSIKMVEANEPVRLSKSVKVGEIFGLG
jgi:hypothetical protein